MLSQNKICLLGKGILSFKWQLSYSVMEVKFYLMGLIVPFAAPTLRCVGLHEHVWVVLQNQCQNKRETCIVGKAEKGELWEKAHVYCVTKSRPGYNAVWIIALACDFSRGLKDSLRFLLKKRLGDQTCFSIEKHLFSQCRSDYQPHFALALIKKTQSDSQSSCST